MVRAADVDIHIGADTKDAERGFSRVDGLVSSIGGNLIGGVAQEWFIGLTNNVVDMAGSFLMANANAETMMNSLEIATGSAEKAGKTFEFVKQMASQSSFEMPELMQAAVVLESLGVSATQYLTTIGDTAAATGKTVDMATQAFLDAGMGEFERLKEFGIQAVEENGKTYLQYQKNGKMIREEVDRNNAAMTQSTLAAIWNDLYGGAMVKQSSTFIGLWSTLKDNWNMTMQDMSKGVFEFAKKGLAAGVDFFNDYNGMLENGSTRTRALEVATNNLLLKFFSPAQTASIMAALRNIMNGLKQFLSVAKSVASFIGKALGAAFKLLFSNIELVVGAAKGLMVLFGILLGFSAITGILAGVGAALALLLSPLGLILIAAMALGIAWQTNFLGMQDAIKSVIDVVLEFVDAVMMVAGGVEGAQEALDGLPGPIAAVALAFGQLIDIGRDLFNAFQEGGISGLLDALPLQFERAKSVLDSFIDSMSGFAASLGNWVLDTGIPTITGWIMDAAGNVWEALKTAAGWAWDAAEDLGAWSLNTAMPTIGGWLRGAGMNVWNALKSAAGWSWDAAEDLGAWSLSTVAPHVTGWFSDIGGWITDQLDAVPWESVGATFRELLLGAFSNAFSGGLKVGNALGGLAEIGAQILDRITAAIEDIEWDGVGETVGRGIVEGIIVTFGTIGSLMALGPIFIAGIINNIGDADWGQIATSIGNFIITAAGAWNEFQAGLVTGIGQAFMDAMGEVHWSNIASYVSIKLSEAFSAAKNFATRMGPRLGEEIRQALDNIDWGGIASYLGNKLRSGIDNVKGFATGIGATLFREFMEAINNVPWIGIAGLIATKIRDGINAAKGFATGLGATLFREFMEALNNVSWVGLVTIIKDKIKSGISNLKGFATDLGGTLGSELSQAFSNVNWTDLAGTIKTKLVEAVAGIGSAMGQAILDEIQDKLGGLWDWISDKAGGADNETANFFSNTNSQLLMVTTNAKLASGALKSVWDAVSGRAAVGGGGSGGAPGAGGGGGPFASIITGMQQVVTMATTAAMQLRVSGFEGGLAFASGVAGGISGGTATVTGAIAVLSAATAAFGETMRASGFTSGLAFSTGTAGGISAGTSTVSGAVSRLVAVVSGSAGSFRAAGFTVGLAGGSGVAGGLSGSAGTVRGGMNTLIGTVNGSAGSMRAAGFTVGLAGGSGVAGGLSGSAGTVRGAMGSIVGAVSGYAGTMRAAGFTVGMALGQGIAGGISAMVSTIAAAAANAVSAAIGAAQAAGAISSPSRLMMMLVGAPLAQGVAAGITQHTSDVTDAMKDLVRASANMAVGNVSGMGNVYPTVQAGSLPMPYNGGGGIPAGTTVNYYDQRTYDVTVDVSELDELTETREFFENMEADRQKTFGR